MDQAASFGFSVALLAHHAREGGRFERVRKGLYRLRHFPRSRHEETISAWLSVGAQDAAVSHESALELYDLGDVIPRHIHLTAPRSRRGTRSLPAVKLHTTTRPPEVRRWNGIAVTSPEQTISDVAEAGFEPAQLRQVVRAALERGLVTEHSLRDHAAGRSATVRAAVEDGLGVSA